MPKLEGIEYKELFGLSVDKENSELFFSDASHSYVNKTDGSRYISVTTLIDKYVPKFDELFWAKYKALELFLDGDVWSNVKTTLQNTKKWNPKLLTIYNINEEDFNNEVENIRADWAANRDEACDHGSYVHSLMENTFYGNTQFDLGRFGYPEASGTYDCPRNYYELDLENAIYPEFLMSWTSPDGELKIAGQADLIIKEGNDIICLDWKTNKEIKKRSFYDKNKKDVQRMLYPLNDLMDCNYQHYELQLSTYCWILQQIRPEFNIKGLSIIHIDRNGKQTEYPLEYRKEHVEKMIKHYKNQLAIQKQLDRLEPYKIG